VDTADTTAADRYYVCTHLRRSLLIRHPLKAFSDAKGMKSGKKIIPIIHGAPERLLRLPSKRKITQLYGEIFCAVGVHFYLNALVYCRLFAL
jgi:hypothetical protein